jgi:uncharacterized membrane protein YqhA
MNSAINRLEIFIFWSRWLQAPLYLGLIIAQFVYVYLFLTELGHLVHNVFGETFVSRLDLEGHPDQPEWLSHVNAGVLKIKLAAAIIGISSIHLLKTFINAEQLNEHIIKWQVIIHALFLLSALAMVIVDRIMNQTLVLSKQADH